jgi:hypothetical protein
MRVYSRPSKPELSTWLAVGTFYLAPTDTRVKKIGLGKTAGVSEAGRVDILVYPNGMSAQNRKDSK